MDYQSSSNDALLHDEKFNENKFRYSKVVSKLGRNPDRAWFSLQKNQLS